MAETYDRYPGFRGRPGLEFLDEVQRCEAEIARARAENREPLFDNDWLDLCEGKITFEEYAGELPKALPVAEEETPVEEEPPTVTFEVPDVN